MYKISKSERCKNREKYTLKKNNHTQDSIYMIRQIVYIYGVVRISLFLGKNTRCSSSVFSLKNNIKPKSPKQQFLYPPFHRLSLKKSLIKNRNNIISSQVII